MSNDTTLDMCLSGFYHSMQATALERALELIEEVGDAKSKVIASEALSMVDGFEASLSDSRAVKVKVKVKAKRTKSQKKTLAKISTSRKPAATIKAAKKGTKAAKTEKVTLLAPEAVVSLNGDSYNRLKDWREKEDLSQKKAASRAEVSVGSWQAWESGKWPPSDEMLRRLEKLGV